MSDGNGNSWDWPTEADKSRITEAHGIKPRWSLWATRYEQFRLMGPRRSVLAVYNQERDKAGKSGKQSAPGSWGKYSSDWLARAEKWDEAERKREAKEREAEEQRLREEARQQRRLLLTAGQSVLARAMGELNRLAEKEAAPPNTQEAVRVATAIQRFNAESRAEYGDMPTQKHEIAGLINIIEPVRPDNDSADGNKDDAA